MWTKKKKVMAAATQKLCFFIKQVQKRKSTYLVSPHSKQRSIKCSFYYSHMVNAKKKLKKARQKNNDEIAFAIANGSKRRSGKGPKK